jgi:3-oxoacyl-[acyl-carrier protein] reductase
MDKRRVKQLVKKIIKLFVPEKRMIANVVSVDYNHLLQGRTALITGGTSGIGYSIAIAFAKSGANVIITGHNQERLSKAVDSINGSLTDGLRGVRGIILDNIDVASFERKLEEILSQTTEGTLDILVNNAGLLGGNIDTTTVGEYNAIFNTNLRGAFFLSKVVARHMQENQIHGNILNIASSSSLRPAISAYTLTKWGLRGLTLGLAKVLAPYGITVNGLAPGPTATPMLNKDPNNITLNVNPMGRYAMPEEIANMAVVLCSGIGKMVVGDIVYMTGGAGLLTYDDVNYDLNF